MTTEKTQDAGVATDSAQTSGSLKAYAVSECHENHGLICWAENAKEAKKLCLGSAELFDAEYIDLRCRREPAADELFHGTRKCSWDTEKGQRVYWKLGWWLEDGSCCQECYDCWEFEKVPESKLNDDGLCAHCAANKPGQPRRSET